MGIIKIGARERECLITVKKEKKKMKRVELLLFGVGVLRG